MRPKYPQHSSKTKKEGLRARLKRRIEEIHREIENKAAAGQPAKENKPAEAPTKESKIPGKARKQSRATAPTLSRTKRHLLPVREVSFTSSKAYRTAHRIWGYLLLSLGIEPILIYFIALPPLIWAEQLDTVLAIILTITVPFFWHEEIWRGYRKLINMRRELFEKYSSKITWIGVLVVALISVAEIGVKFLSVKSLWVLPIILIIGGSIVFHTIREHMRAAAHRERIERDPVAWVEQVNREALVLSVTPLVLARIFAVVAFIRMALSGGDIMSMLPYSGIALLLLVGTEPKAHDFMKPCKQCSLMTSIALQEKGYCLACARENFLVNDDLNQALAGLAPSAEPSQKTDSRDRR